MRSRDPSSAWQTAAGEWRYTDANADIYSSWDFESWKLVGNLPSFGTGDCPDFYLLPPTCPGCGEGTDAPAANAPRPTHVRAGGFQAVYALGHYAEGEVSRAVVAAAVSFACGCLCKLVHAWPHRAEGKGWEGAHAAQPHNPQGTLQPRGAGWSPAHG